MVSGARVGIFPLFFWLPFIILASGLSVCCIVKPLAIARCVPQLISIGLDVRLEGEHEREQGNSCQNQFVQNSEWSEQEDGETEEEETTDDAYPSVVVKFDSQEEEFGLSYDENDGQYKGYVVLCQKEDLMHVTVDKVKVCEITMKSYSSFKNLIFVKYEEEFEEDVAKHREHRHRLRKAGRQLGVTSDEEEEGQFTANQFHVSRVVSGAQWIFIGHISLNNEYIQVYKSSQPGGSGQSGSGSGPVYHSTITSPAKKTIFFGAALSLTETTLAVGAPKDFSGTTVNGSVYIYRYDIESDSWDLDIRIYCPESIPEFVFDVNEPALFGYSIHIDESSLTVSAPMLTILNGPKHTGAAFVYLHLYGMWEFRQVVSPGTVANEMKFGRDLSQDGDILIVCSMLGTVSIYTRLSPYYSFKENSTFYCRGDIKARLYKKIIAVQRLANNEVIIFSENSTGSWEKVVSLFQEVRMIKTMKAKLTGYLCYGGDLELKNNILIALSECYDTDSEYSFNMVSVYVHNLVDNSWEMVSQVVAEYKRYILLELAKSIEPIPFSLNETSISGNLAVITVGQNNGFTIAGHTTNVISYAVWWFQNKIKGGKAEINMQLYKLDEKSGDCVEDTTQTCYISTDESPYAGSVYNQVDSTYYSTLYVSPKKDSNLRVFVAGCEVEGVFTSDYEVTTDFRDHIGGFSIGNPNFVQGEKKGVVLDIEDNLGGKLTNYIPLVGNWCDSVPKTIKFSGGRYSIVVQAPVMLSTQKFCLSSVYGKEVLTVYAPIKLAKSQYFVSFPKAIIHNTPTIIKYRVFNEEMECIKDGRETRLLINDIVHRSSYDSMTAFYSVDAVITGEVGVHLKVYSVPENILINPYDINSSIKSVENNLCYHSITGIAERAGYIDVRVALLDEQNTIITDGRDINPTNCIGGEYLFSHDPITGCYIVSGIIPNAVDWTPVCISSTTQLETRTGVVSLEEEGHIPRTVSVFPDVLDANVHVALTMGLYSSFGNLIIEKKDNYKLVLMNKSYDLRWMAETGLYESESFEVPESWDGLLSIEDGTVSFKYKIEIRQQPAPFEETTSWAVMISVMLVLDTILTCWIIAFCHKHREVYVSQKRGLLCCLSCKDEPVLDTGLGQRHYVDVGSADGEGMYGKGNARSSNGHGSYGDAADEGYTIELESDDVHSSELSHLDANLANIVRNGKVPGEGEELLASTSDGIDSLSMLCVVEGTERRRPCIKRKPKILPRADSK